MEQQTIIRVRNLSKKFGSFEAVKNVSFTVNKGDVFGFLGPNGAGKSTTIRCLLSLISPDNGSIELFDKSLNKHRSEILANVGSIIEKPDFYKYLSAQKNLEIFARISGATVSKKDFSGMSKFLFIGVILLILASLANIWLQIPALMLTLMVVAIAIFSAFILVDVQRVVNGGETNYVIATLGIYLSVYNIFSNLLALLGIFGGDRDW